MDWDNPRLSTVFFYSLLAIIGLAVSIYAPAYAPISGLVVALGIFLAAAALWNWLAMRLNSYHERKRIADRITPFSAACNAASALTPEQAAIVPRLTYQMQVEVTIGAHAELGFVLATPGGPVPYTWIDDFLKNSGVTHLRPIGSYSDKTPGRLFARAFTD